MERSAGGTRLRPHSRPDAESSVTAPRFEPFEEFWRLPDESGAAILAAAQGARCALHSSRYLSANAGVIRTTLQAEAEDGRDRSLALRSWSRSCSESDRR